MKKNLIALSGLFLGLALVLSFTQSALAESSVRGGGGTAIENTCGAVGGAGNATTSGSGSTIETIICRVGSILNTIIPFLIVLGVLYFVWGVVSYVIADDSEAKKKGRDRIIYGVIGLAAIVGVWGLVNILNRTFNSAITGPVSVPCIVGTPGC